MPRTNEPFAQAEGFCFQIANLECEKTGVACKVMADRGKSLGGSCAVEPPEGA